MRTDDSSSAATDLEAREQQDVLLELGRMRKRSTELITKLSTVDKKRGELPLPGNSPERQSSGDTSAWPAPTSFFHDRIFKPLKEQLTWDLVQTCTKAVFAYYVTCLFVLISPIAEAFGPTVFLAPIAVLLFPPVRPFGAIIETILMGLVGIGFGSAISALALFFSVMYMESVNELETTGHGSDLIQVAFLLVAVFILGYVRASFPRLYAATVLSCLMLAFPLTTHISARTLIWETVSRVLKPLIAGAIVCVVADLLLFPKFSGKILKSSIKKTVTESKELMNLLVQSFLLVNPENPIPIEKILAKQTQVRDAIAKTKAARRECRYEITYDRYSPDDYKLLVQPLQEMMKYLSGMVACVKLEKDLVDMMESEDSPEVVSAKVEKEILKAMSKAEDRHSLHVVTGLQRPRLHAMENNNQTVRSLNHLTTRSLRSLKAASVDLQAEIAEGHHVQLSGREITGGMFGGSKKLLKKYLAALSSAMTDLCAVCVECLEYSDANMLRFEDKTGITSNSPIGLVKAGFLAFTGGLGHRSSAGHETLGSMGNVSTNSIPMTGLFTSPKPKLQAAMKAFEEREWKVMTQVSRQTDPMASFEDLPSPVQPENHWNAANLFREEYFLASFFVFNMKECASKVVKFEEAVQSLRQKRLSKHRFWLPRMKLAQWLKGGDSQMSVKPGNSETPDIPLYTEGKETFLATGRLGQLRWSLWKASKHLQSRETLFATKMALTCLILVWPAYIWQDWWNKWKCTWALVTMLIVISPTVGTSNIVGLYRIIGTIAGGFWGYVTWIIAPQNPYSISVMTIIFAYPCLYLFVKTPHARLGTAALVTYTVIVMSTYATFEDPKVQDTILALAAKRMITITVGVLAAVIVTSYVWPFVARTELRKGLSNSLYLISVLYSHLAAIVANDEVDMNPSHYTMAKHNRARLEIRRLEHTLMKGVTKHQELLELTHNEPRLKGPFPYAVFAEMVAVEQNIVERLGNVRRIVDGEYTDVVPGAPARTSTTITGFAPFVKREIVIPVEKYRIDMFASLLLYLHTLSHSLHSKLPLPPFLPPARAARLRLFSKIRALPALRDRVLSDRRDESEGYIRFMAYSLAMEDLIENIEELGALVRRLYGQGVIGER
ncbi:hypothetical protein PhCBS80983_g02226 [Powellomyces hirtus]|uniref:Uncharacterized protein n=1 Tax=Powellomyces hirtus TaxID=109895 RepID=A0A507E6T2_9FUNG|nr:hypothetical protein PhCBS80983_g02226 [Powellomyces hirtus]